MSLYYINKKGLETLSTLGFDQELHFPLKYSLLKNDPHRYKFTLFTKPVKVSKLTSGEDFRKIFPSAVFAMIRIDYGNLDAKPTAVEVKEGSVDDRIVLHNVPAKGTVSKWSVLIDDSWIHLSAI